MAQYTVKCPICGTENKDLFLDETDGWLVCAKCGNEVQLLQYAKTVKIPVIKNIGYQNIKEH